MSNSKNYIKWIRSKVGNDMIILNFVGGCIKNEKGEILLQKRKDKQVWGFPGGALEIGESVEIAAKREIKEETGLDVIPKKIIGIHSNYYDEYPNGDKVQPLSIFLELDCVGGELCCDNDETLDLKYFNIDCIPKLVNKQHEDFLEDIRNNNSGVLR